MAAFLMWSVLWAWFLVNVNLGNNQAHSRLSPHFEACKGVLVDNHHFITFPVAL